VHFAGILISLTAGSPLFSRKGRQFAPLLEIVMASKPLTSVLRCVRQLLAPSAAGVATPAEMLDQELHQLPESYRTPLVLCYLEGRSIAQAAHDLDYPAQLLPRRLDRAREVLRRRLIGRGLAVTPAGLVLMLTESAATPGVSEALMATTVRAAADYAAGSALAVGTVSAEAVALAEGAFHTMATTKMKIAAAVLLAGLMTSGARVLIQAEAAQQPVAAAADTKTPAAADAKTDVHGDPLPAGAVMRLGTLRWRHGTPVIYVAYLGDGKEVLTVAQDASIRVWEQSSGKELRRLVKAPVKPEAPKDGAAKDRMYVPQGISNVTSSADGKILVMASHDGVLSSWDVAAGKELKSFPWDNPGKEDRKRAYYGGINAMAFSVDGKQLLARCPDNTLRLYDPIEGKEIRKFTVTPVAGQNFNFYNATSVGFSADGKLVQVAGLVTDIKKPGAAPSAVIKSWDVGTGKEQADVKGPAGQANFGVAHNTISPDGKTAVFFQYGNPGTFLIWETTTGKELHKVQAAQGLYPSMLNFSRDGKTLAARGQDGSIRLIDVAAGKETHHLNAGGNGGVAANGFRALGNPGTGNIAFSADGKWIITGAGGNTVCQFDVATGKELAQSSGHHGSVIALAVSPDGKSIVTRGSNNAIHLWDTATGKESKRYALPTGSNMAAFSADGSLLVLGMQNNQKRGEIAVVLWDVKEGKELRQWPAGQNGFVSVAISPDGKFVATRDYAGAIKTWDAAKGIELKSVVAVAQEDDGNIKLARVAFPGGYQPMSQAVVFSPDSTLLATVIGNNNGGFNPRLPQPADAQAANAPSLRIYDVATGKMVRRFDAPKVGIVAFAFSADGRTIATINSDNTASLWEAASGKQRFVFPVADNSKQPVRGALDIEREKLEAELQRRAIGYSPGVSTVQSLAYATDSRSIATGGADGIVRVWDLSNGKEITQFKGHDGAVVSLVYSGNGKRLVSGSADTTALVWDAPVIGAMANGEIDATRADTLWADLMGNDAVKAYQAIVAFRAAPKTAVPFLKERVKAVPAPDVKKMDQLIADLDSNQFAVRMKANDELERMGKAAKGALDQAMASGPNLEMRQRIERLLEKLVTGAAPPAEQQRIHRSLEVLEWIGTPESQEVLQTVAKGAAGADVTVDAKSSLDRLGKR